MTRQQPIPLKDGSHVSFNYTFLNLGFVNVPTTDISTLSLGSESGGLLHDVLLTPRYGGPYTFVVPQIYMPTLAATLLSNLCEESESCMVLHPFSSSANAHVCIEPLPPDCIARGRVEGMRRFNTLLGGHHSLKPATHNDCNTEQSTRERESREEREGRLTVRLTPLRLCRCF